ncbi:hypothetical protein HAX54_044093 [Datura stramonium]|uniref:Uncharacterized protein n=1 Tax=Datura stramonium TaxID=4076 RepID=A0ABS8W4N3_DATST|nr:hypothetical protein [Datura stramonium]
MDKQKQNRTSTSGSHETSSEKDDDKPAFNPFGLSLTIRQGRSAIQMPESPAEDGNVGQMLYDYQKLGDSVIAGSPENEPSGTVVFLHGAQHNHAAAQLLCLSLLDTHVGLYHSTDAFSLARCQMLGSTALHLTGSDLDLVTSHNLVMVLTTLKEFHEEFEVTRSPGVASPFSL